MVNVCLSQFHCLQFNSIGPIVERLVLKLCCVELLSSSFLNSFRVVSLLIGRFAYPHRVRNFSTGMKTTAVKYALNILSSKFGLYLHTSFSTPLGIPSGPGLLCPS